MDFDAAGADGVLLDDSSNAACSDEADQLVIIYKGTPHG